VSTLRANVGPLWTALKNIALLRSPDKIIVRWTPGETLAIAYTNFVWMRAGFRLDGPGAPGLDEPWFTITPGVLGQLSATLGRVRDTTAEPGRVQLDWDRQRLAVRDLAWPDSNPTVFNAEEHDGGSDLRSKTVARVLLSTWQMSFRKAPPVAALFAINPDTLTLLGRLAGPRDAPVDCKIVELAPGRPAVAAVHGPRLAVLCSAIDRTIVGEQDLLTDLDGKGPNSWMWKQ
jgi:hypothetical protein